MTEYIIGSFKRLNTSDYFKTELAERMFMYAKWNGWSCKRSCLTASHHPDIYIQGPGKNYRFYVMVARIDIRNERFPEVNSKELPQHHAVQ